MATRDEDVFVRDRHAEERAALAGSAACIGGACLRQRGFAIDGQRDAEMLVIGKACEQMCRDLGARDFAGDQTATERGHAERVQGVAHSITRGTR